MIFSWYQSRVKEIETILYIFSSRFKAYFNHGWQIITAHGCQLHFIKKDFGGDLKLKLVRNRTLFTFSFYK